MNFPFLKKILLIFFLLIFSINANAIPNINVDYTQEILIEKGWTKYVSISVNNSGDSDLHNVNVLIEGISTDWFEFQNNKTDVIPINEKKDFITKISIPYDTAIGNYNFSFIARSDEINYKTDFTVRVFGTREDLLLYQIQNFRNDLNELESEADKIESTGKNLTSARSIFNEIKNELNLAEEQVYNKMYTQETESIRDVEKLFIKAKFEISNPLPIIETKENESISIKDLMLYSSGLGIFILLITLIYLIRKVKIENKVRLPNLRIRELIIENKRLKELESEIGKIRESQEIIEEEYRENMISKESYEELRLKYQEKLLELEGEKRKLRGY